MNATNTFRKVLIVSAFSFSLSPFAFAADNVVIVLDNSGSMQNPMRSGANKMQAAKDAINTVLGKLPPSSNVGLLIFQNQKGIDPWIAPLGPIDKPLAKKRIATIRPSGGTPLGQYMKVATDALLQARKNERFGSYRLLIVSDGEANDAELVKKYLPDILARGIVVDVIGVAMKSNHSLATQVHSYRKADDKASLERAIQQVLAESTRNERGESNYSLLSGISNDLGQAMISALAEAGAKNEPIRP